MIHQASPIIGTEEIEAVVSVMRSGMLAQGAQVAEFETEFAAAFDAEDAAAVSNGTMALVVALQAVGVQPGDEVIVPSFTFAATANAVALLGAVPVFADIDAETYCIEATEVEALISERTRGVIAVHLYGHMAPMKALAEIGRTYDLFLIEDAAQAHGAKRDGLPVGSLSDLSAYSFYPTKNMTTGEGGMVTGTGDLIEKVRLLRNHGMAQRYHHDIIGTNARMTDLGAAIGRVQLGKLAGWNERRREIAAAYDLHLAGVVKTPTVAPDTVHVYHQYTIRSSRRDNIIESCREAEIGFGIYYPIPCHRQAAFRQYATGRELPTTDRVAEEVLSLPMRPDLTDNEIERVIDAVNKGAKS
jgi:dTDP-4-amino-4,6-dideoxygalactose transaminase